MNNINEVSGFDQYPTSIDNLITIDTFYSISQYNEALQALENNGISYNEWISLKTGYNFYLNLPQKPIMVNYEVIDKNTWQRTVSKVQPLTTTDEVLLYRRGDVIANVKRYVNNDVFDKALESSNTIVFNYKNREQLLQLSNSYGPIYPLGKYLRGAKRLAVCFNINIKNVLSPIDIEAEIGEHKFGELEIIINNVVLRRQDKIIKWSRTPYYNKGQFFQTSPSSPLKF